MRIFQEVFEKLGQKITTYHDWLNSHMLQRRARINLCLQGNYVIFVGIALHEYKDPMLDHENQTLIY